MSCICLFLNSLVKVLSTSTDPLQNNFDDCLFYLNMAVGHKHTVNITTHFRTHSHQHSLVLIETFGGSFVEWSLS